MSSAPGSETTVSPDEPSLRHHCGVVGIYNPDGDDIPELLFYALFSLQHRGQESAGIAYRKQDRLVVYKDLGMVATVLGRYLRERRTSNVGIGHVRYSTHGGNKLENAQPILATCNKGDIAIAHNGNISNTESIRSLLAEEGSIFQSSSDTEIMLHLIARSRANGFLPALRETLAHLEGAYSLAIIHNDSLVAVRDPLGFRPLYVGSRGRLTMVASETCAFEILRVTDYRPVEPGELIIADGDGFRSERFADSPRRAQCVFELIYFARPDSEVFDRSVYDMRKRMGAALAEDDPYRPDIVIPVPDSGNTAALGYAAAAGIPLELGLTRNHYTGRSFILPTTSERELAVRMKLHPVRSIIKGKRVVLVDDSLVRGTTASILVKLVREAGAREIHLRLSSPELTWPCYFGIDIPTRSELVSNRLSPEEIASQIGADSVRFLSIERLQRAVGGDEDFCYACFTGRYPVEIVNRSREE